jgi:hypothetical protein
MISVMDDCLLREDEERREKKKDKMKEVDEVDSYT